MSTFTQDWHSHNIPVWEQVLAELKNKPIKVLEIGVFEGRATVWLLQNILTHPDARIICVDPFQAYSEMEDLDWDVIKQRFLNNIRPWKEQIVLITEESSKYLRGGTPNQFDLIYVDGAHTSSQALIDGVLSHLLLKSGGIIIFDDYMWAKLTKAPNVPKAAIDAFMDCFAEEYDWLSTGYQVFLKKR